MSTILIDPSQVGNKPACPDCHKKLAHISSVYRHMRDGSCRVRYPNSSKKELIKSNNEKQSALDIIEKRFDVLTEKIEQGISKGIECGIEKAMKHITTVASNGPPTINNTQNLSVLCLGNNDNLLDMLALDGGIHNALTYMKNCALAQLSGDCRILQRAYKLETEQAAIHKLNDKGTKLVYYDERRRRTTESNSDLGKKLASILQRSYLKAMGGFRKDILGNKRDDPQWDQMPELDEYEYTMMDEHVHQLNDSNYQKKLVRSLKIPEEPKRE